MAFCMEQALLRGQRICDFMRGTEQYKYELDAIDVPNWVILQYSPTAFKPELRYTVDLLLKSLKRRTTRERLLLQGVVSEYGLLSNETWQLVTKRFKQILVDGVIKAKEPARASTVRPKGDE
jgi:hypothetical protein